MASRVWYWVGVAFMMGGVCLISYGLGSLLFARVERNERFEEIKAQRQYPYQHISLYRSILFPPRKTKTKRAPQTTNRSLENATQLKSNVNSKKKGSKMENGTRDICPNPVRLVSGPHGVNDSALTSSGSCCADGSYRGPICARIGPINKRCYGQAWMATLNLLFSEIWIQVDLGVKHWILSILLRGRHDMDPKDFYTKSFELAKYDRGHAEFYPFGGKIREQFLGNVNKKDVVRRVLNPPMVARRVRIYPFQWTHNLPALAFDLLGCKL